ncbi:MAG: choice-of-anchor J domain-containing protein [Lewinellaceae bacterium]|nr:choice-of-anchor J domain-containing protein [Lewinellaceae bacterium]
MKNFLLIFFFFLTGGMALNGQILLQEDFESGTLPDGWSIQTNATDGGWAVGAAAAISSQYWDISNNGSQHIAATNDDACNCDKSQDYLIMPPLNLSGLTAAALRYDVFYAGNTYQGSTERATIEVSLDGTSWQEIAVLPGHNSWETQAISLSDFVGEDTVYLGFHYDDDGGWMYGFAIDNVEVGVPSLLDAGMQELNGRAFGENNTAFPLSGHIVNNGVTEITSLEVAYSINDGTPVTELFENLSLEAFGVYDFELSNDWIPTVAGVYQITVEIISVNGQADENADNNSTYFETEIFEQVVPPNKIDEFLSAEPVFQVIATAADQLSRPTDLDFFPILGKNELWVVNQRTETSGGSTVTFYNVGTSSQTTLYRVDGNAWHFMSLPTGIAFGDNLNWATSPGVQDANHGGGTFTGPTLWSSDPEIYAQPSGGNGSHLDMLHGSPYSMGIAHETGNVYWVTDTWNEHLVRYDFVEDHGPGNDDHADAMVRRYQEVEVRRDGDVPSHLVLDKTTGWLYIVDNGTGRILRLDINSGNVAANLPLINEPLAEHSRMENVNWEVIVDEGLDHPCGIEVMENRLLVSDYGSGDIIIYNIDNAFAEMGRINTGAPGITGIKVGPAGNIWYTNRTQNRLTKVVPGEISAASEPAWEQAIKVLPNPTSGQALVYLPELPDNTGLNVELTDMLGKKYWTKSIAGNRLELDLGGFPSGIYLLTFFNGQGFATKRIVLEK